MRKMPMPFLGLLWNVKIVMRLKEGEKKRKVRMRMMKKGVWVRKRKVSK